MGKLGKAIVYFIFAVLFILLIKYVIWPELKVVFHNLKEETEQKKAEKKSAKSSGCYYDPEALIPRQEHNVQPDEVWTSEFVNYKYKFRSEAGAPYMIKFTGMKDFVLRTVDAGQPPGAKPGPVQIKLPDGTTAPVKMQLYQRGAKVCP